MESLGEFLRTERESRKVRLEDVAERTKISLTILKAFESDDQSRLPGKTFSKGLLKSYAHFLGLDEADVLLRYDHCYQTVNEPEEKYNIDVIDDLYADKSKKAIRILLALFIIVAVVILFMNYSNSGDDNSTAVTAIDDTVTDMPATDEPEELVITPTEAVETTSETEPSEESATSAEATPAVSTDTVAEEARPEPEVKPKPAETRATTGKKHKVVFRAQGIAWMLITVDNKKTNDITLRKGETFTRKFDKKVKYKVGNAGNLKVTLDGKDLGYAGKPGEVKTVTLP